MIRIIILVLFSVYLTAGDLYLFNDRFQPSLRIDTVVDSYTMLDTSDISEIDTIEFIGNYPAKPMLYSLLLPGLGQYKNGDPLWKSAMFVGVELASFAGWAQWSKKAEDIRNQYEKFGDIHWTLKSWVENTKDGLYGLNQYEDAKIDGTHKLTLHLSGSLAEVFGEFVSSDSLVNYPEWIYSEDLSLSKDQHFYENIGKYDQFVGGWDDINLLYTVNKIVEDTTEVILMTPNKNDYISERDRSNKFLKMANFAVTAIMFNHVISGLEAVFTNQRQARDKAQKTTKTDVGLYFDPRNKYGVGGIAVSYEW